MRFIKFIAIIIVFTSILSLTGCTFFDYFTVDRDRNDNAFDIDESKNKLAVLLKKNGIFDTSEIREKLNGFLDAVENNLEIDTIGVFQVDADSLDDLDAFVENLYYEEDVGYIIMIGRDLAWDGDGWKKIGNDIRVAFRRVNDKLCYIGSRDPGERGLPPGTSDYKDIAISWIVAPEICYSNKTADEINSMKRDIISRIISTYTYYHNNANEVINRFKKSTLYIYDQNNLHTFYEKEFNDRYQFDWTLVINTDYDKVWEEMKKHHLILQYRVHGTRNSLMINQNASEVFTTVDDYLAFIEKNGLPSLFIDAGACEWIVFQRNCTPYSSGINYCWPQVNICNGVWAHYGGLFSPACKELSSTSTYLGYVLRRHQTSAIVFGDITAHMHIN